MRCLLLDRVSSYHYLVDFFIRHLLSVINDRSLWGTVYQTDTTREAKSHTDIEKPLEMLPAIFFGTVKENDSQNARLSTDEQRQVEME